MRRIRLLLMGRSQHFLYAVAETRLHRFVPGSTNYSCSHRGKLQLGADNYKHNKVSSHQISSVIDFYFVGGLVVLSRSCRCSAFVHCHTLNPTNPHVHCGFPSNSVAVCWNVGTSSISSTTMMCALHGGVMMGVP